MPDPTDPPLTVSEAAALMGVTRRMVLYYDDELRPIRVGLSGRVRLYDRATVEAFTEARRARKARP